MKRRRAVGLLALVAGLLFAVCGLWLLTQQQQYARNRALIAALIHNDARQALVLAKTGADPNTLYVSPPVPTFKSLLNQLLHHLPPPVGDDRTAFTLACELYTEPNVEAHLVQVMIAQGANVNMRDAYGMTPLIYAADTNSPEIIRLLLTHGANCHVRDTIGRTALHHLMGGSGNHTAVQLLLAHGADPEGRDNNGDTPLKLAACWRRPDLVSLMRQIRK